MVTVIIFFLAHEAGGLSSKIWSLSETRYYFTMRALINNEGSNDDLVDSEFES